MKTFEKIDFLMKITNTSNSALGKYISFDSSYISRIRAGKRNVPKNSSFTEALAKYFSTKINDDYQKQLLCEVICPNNAWPENEHKVQEVLNMWLSELPGGDASNIGRLLYGISSIGNVKLPDNAKIEIKDTGESVDDVAIFYGNPGKRKAVEQFLTNVIALDKMPQLLLYSNEEFDWLYEDPSFSKKWAMLLIEYIKKGGKIKIIHTISRASGEMFEALQKWIPIYMTGAVEPYYYPKILDRVFRRTFFIAEGNFAITSSSVENNTADGINFLVKEKNAVVVLEKEFWSFYNLCKPLMKIYNAAGREEFFKEFEQFNSVMADTIVVRNTPSFYTMPKNIVGNLCKDYKNNNIVQQRNLGESTFEAMMSGGYKLTEVLNLNKEEILGENFKLCFGSMFSEKPLAYSKEDLAVHLESIIDKLNSNPKYNLVLSSIIPPNELVYVKEDVGVVLVKTDFPSIAFVIREQRMVSAFWEYLEDICSDSSKESTVEKLRQLREKIL